MTIGVYIGAIVWKKEIVIIYGLCSLIPYSPPVSPGGLGFRV